MLWKSIILNCYSSPSYFYNVVLFFFLLTFVFVNTNLFCVCLCVEMGMEFKIRVHWIKLWVSWGSFRLKAYLLKSPATEKG